MRDKKEPKPPRGLTAKYVKRKLKEIVAEVKFYDKIVIAGLVASGLQLTVSYAFTGSILSWGSAVFKALFIEACTWIFNKSISRGREMRQDTRFVWLCLLIVMTVSIRANLKYIYKQQLAQHSAAMMKTDPERAKQIALVTDENIEQVLDFGERIDAWMSGALIPILILGVIFCRGMQTQAGDTFERTETVKISSRERTAAYRKRLAKISKGLGGTK